ncbi:MAG: hypothetical protein ACJ75J_11980 [Cytophagaceae bacterium]
MSQFISSPIFKIFILLLVACGPVRSKDLIERIPSTAGAVMVVNSQSFSKKLGLDRLNQFEFMKKFDKKLSTDSTINYEAFSKLLKDPAASGIDVTTDSYAYLDLLDTIVAYTYIFKLSDKAKFEAFVKNAIIAKYQDKKIGSANGRSYYNADDLSIVWTKEYGQLIAIEKVKNKKTPYYDYTYTDQDLSDEQLKAQEERAKKIKEQSILKTIEAITANSVKSLITSNANFKLFLNDKYDLGLWVNMGKSMGAWQNAMMKGSYPGDPMANIYSQFDDLYKDTYIHAMMVFENDKMDLKLRTYSSDKIHELFKGIYNTRVNPDFFQYVMGDSLMFLYGISIDMKKSVHSTLEMYKTVFAADPTYGQKAVAYIDLVSMVINFDRLSTIAKGDFLFTVTGIREFDKTFTTYEYDESYNRIAKEETRKEKMPVFNLMMTVGNQADFQLLLSSLQKLDLIEPEKGYYKIKSSSSLKNKKSTNDDNVYLAISNNIFFITNDLYLVEKEFKKGYDASHRIKPEIQKSLADNAMMFYVDFQSMTSGIQKSYFEKDTADAKQLEEVKKAIKTLSFTGVQEDGPVSTSHLVLNLNPSESSLIQILKLVDIMVARQKKEEESVDVIMMEEEK